MSEEAACVERKHTRLRMPCLLLTSQLVLPSSVFHSRPQITGRTSLEGGEGGGAIESLRVGSVSHDGRTCFVL